MSKQSSVSSCASGALLTTHQRDEEQPQDRWSPNTTWSSLSMLHKHMHAMRTREQKKPCPVPASHQMAHLFRPSAQRDAGLVVPTDRQPKSPHTSWQAGFFFVEDQMLIATRSCCSAASKTRLSVSFLDHETNLQNATNIQKCFEKTLLRTSPSNMDNIRASVSLAEASPLSQYMRTVLK